MWQFDQKLSSSGYDKSLIGLSVPYNKGAQNHTLQNQAILNPISPSKLRARSTQILIAGAILFNLALCFANTVLFEINGNMVIMCELVLISFAFLLAANRQVSLYVTLALFLSYMVFIMMLRPGIDIKAVRDILIPIGFYFVGRNLNDIRFLDRFVVFISLFIVAFGLFEWGALDVYLQYFQPLKYYVARGTILPSQLTDQFVETGLFASGSRFGTRNILYSVFGDHRVSSVFLEPVSLGYFGAIIFIWAAFRKDMNGRWIAFICAALMIVLSDARFGLYISGVVLLALACANYVPRPALLALPFIFITGLLIYGTSTISILWSDDIQGRILRASQMIATLDWKLFLGISTQDPPYVDSGYAYTLKQIGIVGLIFVWTIFTFSDGPNKDSWRFRLALGVYIGFSLIISNSFYSIKTAAILWVMLGAADNMRRIPQFVKPFKAPNSSVHLNL